MGNLLRQPIMDVNYTEHKSDIGVNVICASIQGILC